MNAKIIGRVSELKVIKDCIHSDNSQFLAILGRRRVGKTFLIKNCFNNQFTFYFTGVAKTPGQRQLANFDIALKNFDQSQEFPISKNWYDAFQNLIKLLNASNTKKKIVFIDELPWIDTRNSEFVPALEYFWNSWADNREDIFLIVCGSATSWMINNLINSKGGLHNRITQKIHIEPFSLFETELFLKSKGFNWQPYQIVLVYMVMGGIPYYLDQLKPEWSAVQNINQLCFSPNAMLKSEFANLYGALFKNHEKYIEIIEAISFKKKGISREDIIKKIKQTNGGGLTKKLQELEASSFIRSYKSFGKLSKEKLFQLTDLYSLFYLTFIQKNESEEDENYWINLLHTGKYNAWAGYSFEMVCLLHLKNIKKALGISGIGSAIYTWSSSLSQIDLIIDRKDHVINVVEIKFASEEYRISKSDFESLQQKINSFKLETKTNKTINAVFITPYGLIQNQYSENIHSSITLEHLFSQF